MLRLLRRLALAGCASLAIAAPGWGASTFEIFEASAGAGSTASFPLGTGLLADIDYDASSAEGGSLSGEPTDILIVPFGNVTFTGFTCEAGSCVQNSDYFFTAGGPGTGQVEVHDSRNPPLTGIWDIGTIQFDATGFGGIQLVSCAYHDAGGSERSCDPFVLVSVPEPASGALLGLGVAAFAALRRRSPRR